METVSMKKIGHFLKRIKFLFVLKTFLDFLQKLCSLLVISKMALWQLGHMGTSCTWCTPSFFILYRNLLTKFHYICICIITFTYVKVLLPSYCICICITFIHIYTYMYRYRFIYTIYNYIFMFIYIYICIYLSIYIYICIYIYISIQNNT